jgi:hypothetical protein
MTYAAVAVTAMKLAMDDLVLQELVRYEKLVAGNLVRQVLVANDALFGMGLADIRDQAPMTCLLVVRIALSCMASHAPQRSVGSLHRLRLNPVELGRGWVLGTHL